MTIEEFGIYMSEQRKKMHLSIYKLSKISKVSHSYISQLERGIKGIPSPEILKKLADPLGVPYSELMMNAGYLKGVEKEIISEISDIAKYNLHEFKTNIAIDLIHIFSTLTVDKKFRSDLFRNIEKIEGVAQTHFGKDFMLTPESLLDLVKSIDWVYKDEEDEKDEEKQAKVFEIVTMFKSLAEFEQREALDLINFLHRPDITYNSKPLTQKECIEIAAMLGWHFKDRK